MYECRWSAACRVQSWHCGGSSSPTQSPMSRSKFPSLGLGRKTHADLIVRRSFGAVGVELRLSTTLNARKPKVHRP
jgi:hypothetical protein